LGKGLYWFTSWGLKETKEGKNGVKVENQTPPASSHLPLSGETFKLEMVADVYSTVISTQQIQAWQWVGYGYQRVADEEGQVITIPFGYAEGLTRAMAGQWSVRVGDPAQAGASVELPLVGAISMNYSSARAEDKEKGQGQGEQQWMFDRVQIKHWDVVHVISSNPDHTNNWHEMARINHTITRELLIKMDEKIRRIVI
jgi:alanine racemase